LGEHLLKRRVQRGELQREVAKQLGVTTDTYLLWEKDRTNPEVRNYPAIFRLLGYDPLPAPSTLADRIRRKRLQLGLSRKGAATLIKVDEGTLARWESGEWKPRMSRRKVEIFLGMKPTP